MEAKWIWANQTVQLDQHCVFAFNVSKRENKTYKINISCDSIFAFYVNGTLAGFAQCSDFPYFKYYNTFDITNKLSEGTNHIEIKVWYLGQDFSCYYVANPGLWFEVFEDDELIRCSDEDVPSSLDYHYVQGLKKAITPQLGFSFEYNMASKDYEFANSVLVAKATPNPRPVKNLVLGALTESFIFDKGNYHCIYKLKQETAGFLDLDIISSAEQKVKIVFGEHLNNGHVDENISIRRMSIEVNLKEGENKLLEPLRRIAARYLEIIFVSPIEVNHLSLREVNYPQVWKEFNLKNELDDKIFKACVNTLNLCMHDHYEDCPWREQSLYAMDGRNQMLCGYLVTESSEFQRYNLVLLGKCLNKEVGLLTICAPTSTDLYIPSFSLFYILGVYEYIKYTKDKTILDEIGSTLDVIMNTYASRIDETGLIPAFEGKRYWNFFEWTDGSSEWNDTKKNKYDLLASAIFVYMAKLYNTFKRNHIDVEPIKDAIQKTFYDEQNNQYRLNEFKDSKSSELGNAFALLIGLGNPELANKLLNDDSMVKCSLSMMSFVYDAMLANGIDKEVVLNNIRKTYEPMLIEDFNTVWETELGWKDFGEAGSMCHGWSAIPIYYYLRK